MRFAKLFIIALAAGFVASQAPAEARTWAWAVYDNGSGAIWVANQSSPPNPSTWKRMQSYSFRSQVEAQNIACMLVTQGDLFNRKYTSVQISRGDWTCS